MGFETKTKNHVIKCKVRSNETYVYSNSAIFYVSITIHIYDITHFGVKNNLIIYIGLPIIIFVFSLTNLITYDNNEVIVTKSRQLE